MRTFTEFFGFYQDPFKRTPDVDFYYPTQMHIDALDTLQYLIHSDEPFAVLTGEPGTGKTITIKKFINEHKVLAYFIGAILLFFLAFGGTAILGKLTQVKEVQVPNLVNITKEEAEKKARDLKIELVSLLLFEIGRAHV